MRIWFLLTLALFATKAVAEPARVIASLCINHVFERDAVVVQDAHDLYVRERDVADVPFPRRPETKVIDRDLYYALGSSGIEYTYDPASLTLDIDYKVSTAQRLHVPVPAPALYQNGSSASVAYAATLDGGTPELSERSTLATPGGQLHLGFAKIGKIAYRTDVDGGFYEGSQNGEVLLGDQMLASSGALPSLPLFGIGVTQGTLTRTDAQSAPFERLSGRLIHATTIRIETDSMQPIEVGLEPGPFSIDGIPISAHVSAVDDITKLPVQIAVALPLDAKLLAPGWHQTNAAAGVLRNCVFACATYRGFAAGGSMLNGDSLFLSSGPHAEYLDGSVGIGYDLVNADPNRSLHLSAGLGRLDGALVSYEQRTGAFSFGAGYGLNGVPVYDGTTSVIASSRNIYQTINAAYRRVRFAYQLQRYQTGGARTYDLIDSMPLLHSALQFDLRDRLVTGQTGQVSLGVLVPLALKRWRDTSLVGATIGSQEGPAALLSSQINTPSGFDVGGANGVFEAAYRSDAIEISGSSQDTLTFSGALAFLHGVHFVRDPSGGYVVVIGQRGDFVIGTDGRVHMIGIGSSTAFPLPPSDRVTGIAIMQRSVTVDSNTTLSPSSVYPAPGAGTLVLAKHTRLFAVIGTVEDPKWHYGMLTLANGASSPIGSDGMFYFEELPAGNYSAHVSAGESSCNTMLAVPPSNSGQINIGAVSCEPRKIQLQNYEKVDR